MVIALNSSQAQQNFGQVMDRALRAEDVIIERYGIPRVAILEYERYRRLIEAERQQAPMPAPPQPEATAAAPALDGYRYIACIPGICAGRPVIRGTRTPVKAIAGYHRLGLGVDEMLAGFPHLTPAQVYEALSYYHDHQAEIEQDLGREEIVSLLEQYALSVGPNGRLAAAG